MTNRKTCIDCEAEKPATPVHFYTRRNGELQPRCKGCDNIHRNDRKNT